MSVLFVKNFLEACANCKVLSISIVILPCYLVQQMTIKIFRLKKTFWVVNFMSVLLVKYFFPKTCVNCKVLSIWTVMLPTTWCNSRPLKLWVVNFMSVLLVKHFFKRCVQIAKCYQFQLWFYLATWCTSRPL